MTNEQTNEKTATFDKANNKGFAHLVNATRFSIAGLRSAVQHESAFRQELLAFVFLIPSAAWLATSVWPVIALVCACALVLTVELLNSGIEAAVDRVGTEHHELAGLAKDYGSAAVMCALVIVGILWVAILAEALGVF